MTGPIVVSTDGSDLSQRAIAAGLEVLGPTERVVVVTVIEASDPMAVVGTGTAGGVMSPEQLDDVEREQEAAGEEIVAAAAVALDLPSAETRVLRGDAGSQLCQLASELSARAIVIGSRGRGGFKRALLGSVSDYVVRNAPCPVVVASASAAGDLPLD